MVPFQAYDRKSNWTLETLGGSSASKGAFGLGAAIQFLRFKATHLGHSIGRNVHVDLHVEASGLEADYSWSKNLIEEVTSIGLEYITPQNDQQTVWLNTKQPGELKVGDLSGPCSIVSFDAGKFSIGKEIGKLAGSTYLFLGQGKAVQDNAPDWLNRMLEKFENGDTWGSYTKKFVKNHGLFSNANAVCNVEVNGVTLGGGFENKVGFYSGYIALKNLS